MCSELTCSPEGGQVGIMDADNNTDDDSDRDAGPGGGESDGRLLSATAAGDAEAFGRFYRRHEQQILAYAIAHCANASDVADLVGETFLGALRSAAGFTDRDGEATAWLFGIARHVLAHQRRAFTRRQRLATRLQALPRFAPDEAVAIDAAIDAARLAPQLASALNTLKPRDRDLLQLVTGDGLSPTQAGALLGMNPNTARVRLSRARARLRQTLADPENPPSTHPSSPDPHPGGAA
jgi:RNA polymerase sigma factor (sigma-70 family)